MKSFLFLSVICLLMFACSNDDDAGQPGGSENGSLTFEIAASNEISTNSTTRGPIYSQQAIQGVTSVNVYAFKNNGTDYVYQTTYNIPNWTAGTNFQRYEVPSASNVPIGDYKFLAIGRDTADNYTLPTLTLLTKYQDMIATVSASGNETELFSGTTPVILTSPGTRVPIVMTRVVAGVLGYFKNVPTTINGAPVRYLRLSVSNSNQKVNVTTGAGINTAPAAFNIFNVDFTGRGISGDVYVGNDLSGQGVVKVTNSQLNGAYIVPVTGVTMTLGLYDTNGNALRTWVVTSVGLPIFDLTANHFYTLGQKTFAGTTTGDPSLPGNTVPPGDPTDDDAAIDLMTDQTISITITPNWTLIHNLGLLNNLPI